MSVHKPSKYEKEKVPRQICDFMSEKNTRFTEICKIYLDGMSLDDLPFLTAEDLINLVPSNQYKHRLLMTIMVRRYLYNDYTNDESTNYD